MTSPDQWLDEAAHLAHAPPDEDALARLRRRLSLESSPEIASARREQRRLAGFAAASLMGFVGSYWLAHAHLTATAPLPLEQPVWVSAQPSNLPYSMLVAQG